MFTRKIKIKFQSGLVFGLILSSFLFQSTPAVDAFQTEATQDGETSDVLIVQDATKIALEYAPSNGKTEPHPDFILPSIDGGEPIQLSKYRGKKVLLLHFASW